MKTAEADILEVEDPAKKARSQKAFEALNHIFCLATTIITGRRQL